MAMICSRKMVKTKLFVKLPEFVYNMSACTASRIVVSNGKDTFNHCLRQENVLYSK